MPIVHPPNAHHHHRHAVRVAGVLRAVFSPTSLLVLGMALLLTGCTTDTHLSFLNPQGPVAAHERTQFLIFVGILLVFVAAPIFLVLPAFLWRYRYNSRVARYTPKWSFSRLLEVATWGGPIVIVIVLGVMVWRSTQMLDPYRPIPADQPALNIQVIGYDWKWLFIYPEQGIASIGRMPMVAGRPVALKLTSATVMQSLFIPALGSQIYAMGGMTTQLHLLADKPGRFLGVNTMYSGDGFHKQQFEAVALSAGQFQHWVQHVQASGIPMDTAALRMIAEPGNRKQLRVAFGQPQKGDNLLYFRNVNPGVFGAVVMATMRGTGVQLPNTRAMQGAGVETAQNASTDRSLP